MKRIEPKKISEVIAEMVASTGQQENFDRQRVCYLWPEVVGAAINSFTVRRYIDGTVMHVYITSASLKNELGYARESLVRRLNEAAGRQVITDVVIH